MTDKNNNPNTTWVIHAHVVQLADGTMMIKPQKPRMRATSKLTSRLTGLSLKTLRILSDAGFIRCARPSPGTCFYYPLEVEAFIKQTEDDPAFWDKVKKATYLKSARLRNGSQLGRD